ncbi:MAG TPA: polysaccharide biosynthesis tyrosine autokinase [Mycobacteriales bacterium]|nr:polysaccharide biosynthesis tyrosine autokinase [Mycobacteriales bacterium]
MDLVQLLAMVRRRRWPIVICLIAGLGGGVYFAEHGSPVYRATSRTYVYAAGSTSLSDSITGIVLTTSQINTYAAVASSRSVATRVISDIGLDTTPDKLRKNLSAVVETGTQIIDITAEADTAAGAQRLADAAATALSAELIALQPNDAQRLSAELLDTAPLPTHPTSPNPPLDITVGILLGLLAGLGLAGSIEALDRTVKTSAHGDSLFGAPLLAAVPRRRGPMVVVTPGADRPESEPYRTLRTAVRFLRPDRPIKTLLVTSAGPGEGKTTTAANLAVAIALSGERVVVLDADLRRAGLATAFGLEHSVGLTSLVLGTSTLNDALQHRDRNLEVLASGPLPPNPSEIVGSQLFNHVLQSLTEIADIVIIDAPPLLPVTDALAMAAQVDGVLIVARHGATLRSAASQARSKLDNVGANVVGYVLNAVPAREARTYYAEYYYRPQSRLSGGGGLWSRGESGSDSAVSGRR